MYIYINTHTHTSHTTHPLRVCYGLCCAFRSQTTQDTYGMNHATHAMRHDTCTAMLPCHGSSCVVTSWQFMCRDALPSHGTSPGHTDAWSMYAFVHPHVFLCVTCLLSPPSRFVDTSRCSHTRHKQLIAFRRHIPIWCAQERMCSIEICDTLYQAHCIHTCPHKAQICRLQHSHKAQSIHIKHRYVDVTHTPHKQLTVYQAHSIHIRPLHTPTPHDCEHVEMQHPYTQHPYGCMRADSLCIYIIHCSTMSMYTMSIHYTLQHPYMQHPYTST